MDAPRARGLAHDSAQLRRTDFLRPDLYLFRGVFHDPYHELPENLGRPLQPPTDIRPIRPGVLVEVDDFAATHPLRVDPGYAQAAHPDNMFGEAIYRPGARMWAHRLFAPVILRAAEL